MILGKAKTPILLVEDMVLRNPIPWRMWNEFFFRIYA